MANAAEQLPKDLVEEISSYCSPSTLASLALVQKKFQHEAERKLYSSIVVQTNTSSISILKTLGSNHRKAESVQFLQMEDEHDPDPLALETFLSILPKLGSLRDLRIRLYIISEGYASELRLSKFTVATGATITTILKERYFTLHTLFCNNWLDLLDIVQSQRSLDILGIYDFAEYIDPETLRLLEYLHTVPHGPIPFSVGRDTAAQVLHMLGLFPCFNLPLSTNTYKTIVSAMDRDRGQRMELSREVIGSVCLFFENFNNIHSDGYLTRSISDMATFFPNIEGLMLLAREPSQLDLTKIKTTIAPLQKLVALEYFRWDGDSVETNGLPGWGDSPNAIDLDEKLHYAQEWEDACPRLRHVWFPHGKRVEKHGSLWMEA